MWENLGGSYKPAKVRKGSTFEQLKESVYKTTKIKQEEYEIEIVCNWPTDSGSKAIKIVDDDDVELMFAASTKSIELFVRKKRRSVAEEPRPAPVTNFGVEEYSRMVGNMSIGQGIPSPTLVI